MKLGKPIKKAEDLAQINDLVNSKAYIHFHTGANGILDSSKLPKDVAAIPGKYVKATFMAFHDKWNMEHHLLSPKNHEVYSINNADADGNVYLEFIKRDFDNQAGKIKLLMVKHTIFFHENLSGKKLLMQVFEKSNKKDAESALIVWDDKYCETDIPPVQ